MVAKSADCAPRASRVTAAGVLLLVLVVVLAGCRTSSGPKPHPDPTRTDSVGSPPRAGPRADPRADKEWPIDSQRSTVTIVVRRAGPLARFGHDHVITSAAERGTVWVGDTPAASAFELHLPVDSFEVDLAAARAGAGAEFAAAVPEEARAGTRRNMLRPEVLDVAAFPIITLRSLAASGDWSQPVVKVAVQLRGVTREHDIPVQVDLGPLGVVVRGELQLHQSDYGITPFAVAGGAIQVADALEIRFVIAAGPT